MWRSVYIHGEDVSPADAMRLRLLCPARSSWDRLGLDLEPLKPYSLDLQYLGCVQTDRKQWCDTEGRINYEGAVGKYCTDEDLEEEWGLLARKFPWLDLTCTVCKDSHEHRDKPETRFRVAKGRVRRVPVRPGEGLSPMERLHRDEERYFPEAADRHELAQSARALARELTTIPIEF
jgi:hypothetical protein